MKAVFLRALEESDDKAAVLRTAVCAPAQALGWTRFEVDVETFGQVPRSPFAYWVSDRVRSLFVELPAFESEGRTAKQGLATADDFRFVRLWTEVGAGDIAQRWHPFAKGGKFSPFYADVPLVVDWANTGAQIRNFVDVQSGRVLSRPQNIDYFFRPGLTWPLRGIRFSAQAVPRGCVFSVAGKMAFGDVTELTWLHGLFNARAFDILISFFAGKIGGVQYEVGLIQNIPVPVLTRENRAELENLAFSAWSLRRSIDTSVETSHAYHLPAVLQSREASFDLSVTAWRNHVGHIEKRLAKIQAEIDTLCFNLYGIDEVERRRIERNLGSGLAGSDEVDEPAAEVGAESDEGEPDDLAIAPIVASFISWVVGVTFGRFDLAQANAEHAALPGSKPFAPLPVCSLGMLTAEGGLPVDGPPLGYPVDFPRDGILVSDCGSPRDLVAACRRVFSAIFDDPAARWDEASDILDDRAAGLRAWLAKQFFEQHIKRYSRSHRKAPIYWQLATPTASYSVWLYYHRFTRDTLFRALNDHVMPKLQHEERKLTDMQGEASSHSVSAQRKSIDAQETLVGELRTMRDEVARVAPLWNPNRNDGVMLNFAPLWRLVPQHSSWQRECKSAWDQLCKGDYDWAHLAMHLWPERVVPKCARDRSLAIAHGLDDVFWQEDADGKWQAKTAGDVVVQRLIQERTVPAVKAALNDLLSAPTAIAGRQRRKKS